MTPPVRTMVCPYCHDRTSVTPLSTMHGSPSEVQDYRGEVWYIGACNACNMPVLSSSTRVFILPHPMPSATAQEIPETVRGNLVEAKLCASVAAWRASVAMCRRAIQTSCLDKGANAKDNLIAQINFLRDNGIITTDLHEWATVVRWVGNDGAHPGSLEVDKEDAEGMIDLAEQFLHVLYVAPAKAAMHRAKLGK